MFLKGYPLEAKTAPKNRNQSVHISWARLASFCHLGFISDPLIVSKFHNETHDPKGQENKIYTLVNGRETFYRRHTVPVTSCSEVKYVLKRVSFGSKDCTKKLIPNLVYVLQFYLILNVAIGGTNGFFQDNWTYNSPKPWNNNSPSEPADFWSKRNDWLPSWRGDDVAMQVDYVHMEKY